MALKSSPAVNLPARSVDNYSGVEAINMEEFDLLVELETSLHTAEVRSSPEKLNSLLSDDFVEIGASGRTYDKQQIINSLLDEIPGEIKAKDFQLRKLSDEMVLLIYRAQSIRQSIRSSIWKLEQGQWRMLFHQGTVTVENNW
jgi:hypothetical protein